MGDFNYQAIIDSMRTQFNIDDFDSSLLEDASQREFWKELLNYMNTAITESSTEVQKTVPMDVGSIVEGKSFDQIKNKIDLDFGRIDPNTGRNAFQETLFQLNEQNKQSLKFWNESVDDLIRNYLERMSDKSAGEFTEGKNPNKNWEIPEGQNHIVNEKGGIKVSKPNSIGAFRISDLKNANAAHDFNSGPWVRPQYNIDGETFAMVRGDDKNEYALNNDKEAQFTRKMTDEERNDEGNTPITANWIRLIMPKYLRYVEVEDLNRNFWVISQALTAISAFLFDNDSFFSIFGGILSEIAQLWENVMHLWIALMELNQKDFYSKIHYEVVYLSNSDYEPYMKYDHFDGTDYIEYTEQDGSIVNMEALWEKIDEDLKYLISDYPECNLCIIPIIRKNNYRHNYFNTIAYPGVWYYDRNQERMGHYSFTVDTTPSGEGEQIVNPDQNIDRNNEIMILGTESFYTDLNEWYREERLFIGDRGINDAWRASINNVYIISYEDSSNNVVTNSYSCPYKLRFYDVNDNPLTEWQESWIDNRTRIDLPYGTVSVGVKKAVGYNEIDFGINGGGQVIRDSGEMPEGWSFRGTGKTGFIFQKKYPKLEDGIDSEIFYPGHLFAMNLSQEFFQQRVCAIRELEDNYQYCVPLSLVNMDDYHKYYGLLRPEYHLYGVTINEANELDFTSFYFGIEFRDVAKELILMGKEVPEERSTEEPQDYRLLSYRNNLVLKEAFQKERNTENIHLTLLQYEHEDDQSQIQNETTEIRKGYYQGELVSSHRAEVKIATDVAFKHMPLLPVYKKERYNGYIGYLAPSVDGLNSNEGYRNMVGAGLLDYDKIAEAFGMLNQLFLASVNNSDLEDAFNERGISINAEGVPSISDLSLLKGYFDVWLREPATMLTDNEQGGEQNGD